MGCFPGDFQEGKRAIKALGKTRVLPFLVFWGIPCVFFLLRGFPCFFERFSLLFQGFRGSVGIRESLIFCWFFLAIFQQKRKKGQGRPIKEGKRCIKEGKRPINADGQSWGQSTMVENGPSKKAHSEVYALL